MMRRILSGMIVFAVAVAVGADNLPERDSFAFDFRYEMDVSPLTQDLDGDGFADFVLTDPDMGTLTVADGKAVLKKDGEGVCYLDSSASAGAAGGLWKTYAPTDATGYTIEFRMKTLTMGEGATSAVGLSVSNGGTYDAMISMKREGLLWGSPTVAISSQKTDDAFHTYRLVRMPNENRFVLWCDGVLVKDTLQDAMPSHKNLNRLLFGGIGGLVRGEVSLDYLRFTKGAYAPPSTRSSERFPFKYDMTSVTEGFDPNKTTSAWKMFNGEAGTTVLTDGILSVDQPKGVMRYWRTVGAMDPEAAGSGTFFTLEIRTKIGQAWDNAGGQVLNVVCGTSGSGDKGCMFTIGESKVKWRSGETEKVACSDVDNTDRMHVFRVARGHDGRFRLWRDGTLIADDLPAWGKNDFVRFGIASTSSHGGSFDVDYIRWTTEGMFAPEPSPPGAVVIIR